ncbi:hypothetical protein Taro_049813 [Colocasia esculenta]|uniref:Uncharacterized protein n=1 Tax=Colocasia esculenta TaxID=4460 RepID=A0A843XC22_COLES|nr:hypothetical protein [Colocasia esculenta]
MTEGQRLVFVGVQSLVARSWLEVVVLVGLHCSWLVVLERQLDLTSVTGLASFVWLEEESWQTCTTSSRVVELSKLVLPQDRAASALSGEGGELLRASPMISGGFRLRMARAAWEPREDDARSVGVPSARRLWGVLRRLLPVVACVCDSLVKVVIVVVCPGGGTVLWFSVVPRGSRYMYPLWVELCCGTCFLSSAGDEGLAGSVGLEEESWQTCTTSSRVVELSELVLPQGETSQQCVVVELQLDLLSLTARLRGGSSVALSRLDTGIMNQ